MRLRLALVAALVVAVCSQLLPVVLGQAHAAGRPNTLWSGPEWDTPSPVEYSENEAIVEWMYRNSSSTPPGQQATLDLCGPTCSDLWLAEHRPMPNQAASEELFAELQQLEGSSGIGLAPRLGTALGFASKASAVFGAGWLGWQIGSGIRAKFLKVKVDAPPDGWDGITFHSAGDVLASSGSCFSPTDPCSAVAPVDGYVPHPQGFQAAAWGETAPKDTMPNARAGQCGGVTTPPALMTGSFKVYVQTMGDRLTLPLCGDNTQGQTVWLYQIIRPSEIQSPPIDLTDKAPDDVVTTTTPAVSPPDISPDDMKNRVMQALNSPDMRTLNHWLTHQLDPTSTDDPTANNATLPNCVGDTYAECVSKMNDAGFTHLTRVDLPADETDFQQPPATVVKTVPEEGTHTDVDTEVSIEVNPDTDTYPVAVPEPEDGDTFDSYTARLQQLGLLGRVHVLTDVNEDTSKGPDEVTQVKPQPGTRVTPGSEVDVWVNPSDAPPAGGAPSGDCGLTPPTSSVDLGPMKALSFGSKVPFALIGWVAGSVASLASVSPQTPNWTLHAAGATVDFSFLTNFDGIIAALRLALSFCLWLGVAWFLYGRTIGKGERM